MKLYINRIFLTLCICWLWQSLFLPQSLTCCKHAENCKHPNCFECSFESEIENNYPPHIDSALAYVGYNKHDNKATILEWLKSVNIDSYAAWCAAFVRSMLDKGGAIEPKTRSGLAQRYIDKKAIPAILVLRGKAKVGTGWLAIWKKGNTWKGHIGFVVWWLFGEGETIEGNTTINRNGNQRMGGYVALKKRKIQPYSYFRITHFRRVCYD